MARVNLYISNEVHEKINMIVEKRRQEGARDKDISLSGTASMLLELGLRVYDAQMERKESADSYGHDDAVHDFRHGDYFSGSTLTCWPSNRTSS